MTFRNKTAIAGIGETEFSKNSGRSTLHMACEAILAALADAGLQPNDIDGIIKMSANDDIQEIDLLRSLGLSNLRVFHDVPHGGGAACGTVTGAARAIAAGAADVIVCFRSLNERSERRFGYSKVGGGVGGYMAYNIPMGFVTPAQWVAMFGQRYLHDFGWTTEEFGHLAILIRKHASTNPHAMMYNREIDMEDYLNARWITEPLRLFDCTLDTDGACAVVVVSAEKAKQLKSQPAYIAGAAQGTGSRTQMMTSYQRPSISTLEEATATANEVYRIAELDPSRIDQANLYDHFTPMVLMTLESYGFAPRGKAPDLVRSGRLGLDGDLPLNPHGGHLGDGYLHGFSHILEGVRQIRGTANNQVKRSVKTTLATSGTGVPTSAITLSSEAY